MPGKGTIIGDYMAIECGDGSGMVTTNIEGDEVIIRRTADYEQAVITAQEFMRLGLAPWTVA
jgi:hypothetical protein